MEGVRGLGQRSVVVGALRPDRLAAGLERLAGGLLELEGGVDPGAAAGGLRALADADLGPAEPVLMITPGEPLAYRDCRRTGPGVACDCFVFRLRSEWLLSAQ